MLGDALSGLPNNAAWQGVANDGTYWYVITSQAATKPVGDFGNEENTIRKYRISDGALVLTRANAYPTNPGRFSSGEVIGGKLYVAVRHANVGNFWGRIAVFNTQTLDLIDEHVLSDGSDGGAFGAYGIPEGIDFRDGSFWVVFSGLGGVGNGMSAVGRYDAAFSEIEAYELSANLNGQFGGQDILWITPDEIIATTHSANPRPELQRWRWTGDSFTLVKSYDTPNDDGSHRIGQGFTWYEGHLYLAARFSDRLIRASLDLPGVPAPSRTRVDSDGDGCVDERENGPDETRGGRRDPANPWDYFNPTGGGQNRVGDILAVVAQFGIDEGEPGYSQATDRTLAGPNDWNLGPPNGQQRVDDILHIVAQFGHDCA